MLCRERRKVAISVVPVQARTPLPLHQVGLFREASGAKKADGAERWVGVVNGCPTEAESASKQPGTGNVSCHGLIPQCLPQRPHADLNDLLSAFTCRALIHSQGASDDPRSALGNHS